MGGMGVFLDRASSSLNEGEGFILGAFAADAGQGFESLWAQFEGIHSDDDDVTLAVELVQVVCKDFALWSRSATEDIVVFGVDSLASLEHVELDSAVAIAIFVSLLGVCRASRLDDLALGSHQEGSVLEIRMERGKGRVGWHPVPLVQVSRVTFHVLEEAIVGLKEGRCTSP